MSKIILPSLYFVGILIQSLHHISSMLSTMSGPTQILGAITFLLSSLERYEPHQENEELDMIK
jgi:hypothetical protein